jgi:nickel superoxide dismutase
MLTYGYIGTIDAHCQMPCGIYHDQMVYNQIDQYIETMVKGLTVIGDSKFNTPAERNEFIRWVDLKEKASDDTAELIVVYFLQQKIKPGEEDTVKRLTSAHKLLCSLVQIKQTVDMKALKTFTDEWEKFKLMFHVENYECFMDRKAIKLMEDKIKELEGEAKTQEKQQQQPKEPEPDHDHDHDHGEGEHDHTH